METKVDKIDIKLIKALFESNGWLDIATIFVRTKLPISMLSVSISKLSKYDFVNVRDTEISLNENGKGWVKLNYMMLRPEKKEWREVPKDMKKTTIEPFTPYIPQISELDASLRNKIFAKLKETE